MDLTFLFVPPEQMPMDDLAFSHRIRLECTSREFQPRPDVAASLELESPGYPTKPIDIVAEILSPDDLAVKS